MASDHEAPKVYFKQGRGDGNHGGSLHTDTAETD